uniref:Exostosin GT47 domain-containing protein n=1 Tax=Photinus pyralis TaxID=7054 RepID=A0A1Y1JTS9_PHOPY
MVSTSETSSKNVCHWFGHLKLSRIILLLSALLFLLPLITHYYLSMVESNSVHIAHSAHSHVDLPEDLNYLNDMDLKTRVEELYRIKGSVSSELRDMESKRQKLQQELQAYTKNIEQLKFELNHYQTELNRLKISVEQAQVAQREALEQNTPELALPKRLTPNQLPAIYPSLSKSAVKNCRMFSCFDHSRCALTSGFPVYLYDPDQFTVMQSNWDVDGFLKTTLKQALGYNPHLTGDPKEACVFLVLVGEALRDSDEMTDTFGGGVSLPPLNTLALRRLPYWGGDGRNHILLNLARRDLSAASGDIFANVDVGRALIVQSTFSYQLFRANFDLIISPVLGPPGKYFYLKILSAFLCLVLEKPYMAFFRWISGNN